MTHGGHDSTATGDIHIKLIDDMAGHQALARLFAEVWQVPDPTLVIDPETLRAVEFSGNYVAGAFRGDELLGGAVAFAAPDGHLHSNMAGVAASAQGQGIGFAIKRHQREWALTKGISSIKWTFDPTLHRNARFNLQRLGAVAVRYLPDFYGDMADGLNAGTDPSDRLLADWRIDSDRVHTAMTERLPEPTGTNRVEIGELEPLRDALTAAFAAGKQVTGVTRDGHYVLEAP